MSTAHLRNILALNVPVKLQTCHNAVINHQFISHTCLIQNAQG